ncbi:MAG: 50S ribosomal protein L13 [Nitrospiraceae bacterium]|nr:50S ribosomal protein L13 [Nitrospiraceae bacterium]
MVIIDAKDMILGRLATKIAKLLLMGEEVTVVNSRFAVVSGNRYKTFAIFKQKQDRGTPAKGPFYPKNSALIVKRVIRGMLPFKKERGRIAFKRLKCFAELPSTIDQSKVIRFKDFDVNESKKIRNYVYVSEISKMNGGRK